MDEWKEPYKILFRAITKALEEQDLERVREILISAQMEAEDTFLTFEDLPR